PVQGVQRSVWSLLSRGCPECSATYACRSLLRPDYAKKSERITARRYAYYRVLLITVGSRQHIRAPGAHIGEQAHMRGVVDLGVRDVVDVQLQRELFVDVVACHGIVAYMGWQCHGVGIIN